MTTPSTSSDFEIVVGLETHVQLATRTKMFCGCANTFGAPPNSHTCPVCLGLPGALPFANKEAFVLAIRAGLALGCDIASVTRFDRKNYFYPDLPKGYQISQLDAPINGAGRVELGDGRSVRLDRAHLEEDAGKNTHTESGTLVDLNRAGIPLLEIVTAPDITSADMAYDYLTELQLRMRHIGAGDCDMEKGSLRCDVNISVRRRGDERLGTKIELKNLNSFKMIRRAIEHEEQRQTAVLTGGGRIQVEETRLWDDDANETRLMRTKETSADYRYFADPDLPEFPIARDWVDELRATLPEMPADRRRRYVKDFELSDYDAGVIVEDRMIADWFDATVSAGAPPKKAANWVTGEIFSLLNERKTTIDDLALSPERLAELTDLVEDGTVNHAAARQILDAIVDTDESPSAKADELGLRQMDDDEALLAIVRAACAANPSVVAEIAAGKKKAAGVIVGQIMRETGGRANAQTVSELIAQVIAES